MFESPISELLIKFGVTPNFVTVVGLIIVLVGSVLISLGALFTGAIVVFAGSCLDLIDGTLARKTGKNSSFGAFLDSVVDRIQESLVLFGVFVFSVFNNCQLTGFRCDLISILVFLSLIVSLLVSYMRARSESLGVECKEGIMTRPERVVLLSIGICIFQWSSLALLLILSTIIILGLFTIIQRLLSTYEKLQN